MNPAKSDRPKEVFKLQMKALKGNGRKMQGSSKSHLLTDLNIRHIIRQI